ncbi:energy transducer TonB [Kordiimonas sp. SCSIO 12603]|uniref:energy transducer TonB n=1 Tax=Kordiimonas sp. SCSIO 12603 TaxID=2829596 RepID=UPI0021037369|nr:energy transducer TonB [Kordiimonas sp. SCSIO 12603]UTW58459.1 energy transducer TonB [Kordiimonas sp. SCSIO 12603]
MITRVASSLVVASSVTFGLFFVMHSLVAGDGEVVLNEDKRARFIDVVQDIEEQPPQRLERKVEKPPEVEAPPPEIDTPVVDNSGPDKLNLSVGRANTAAAVDLGGIDLGPSSDGDYLPLVRVQPQYPRRAQERGIEGFVIVELTVAADGTVPPESIVVLQADPKGYFERAAIKAAQKFKYKPKVINGKGQEVTGVTYKFSFNMAQ